MHIVAVCMSLNVYCRCALRREVNEMRLDFGSRQHACDRRVCQQSKLSAVSLVNISLENRVENQ